MVDLVKNLPFDRSVVGNDIERIRLYYESLGYRDVQVDTTIVNLGERKS